MNNTLLQVMPLIIIFMIFVVFIALIKKMISSNQNTNSFQGNQEYRIFSKSESNRVIAGVCGGIAEYFGWNATIVRLFFVFSGIGLLTYIILAIVLPDPHSPLL